MAFFNAYWDESGTHSPDIITLAGYIATDRQWAAFAREWDEALKKEGVNKPFHMKEFESPHGDYTEEKGWSKERRINLQSKLIGIIKRRVNIGIFSTLHVPAYEAIVTGWQRERRGTPYHFCVQSCLSQVVVWAEHFKRQEPIAHVIEHGAGYNHEIENGFHSTFSDEGSRKLFRLGSLSFETKERAIQLQAADMLAYEVWKDEYNFRFLKPEQRRKRRTSFTALLQAPHTGIFLGRQELTRLVELLDSDYVKDFPSGLRLTYWKPDINDITITADSSELERSLNELARLMELSPHVVYPLIDSSAGVSKIVSLNTDDVLTSGASDLRVLFKPTNFLLAFIATTGASERQGGVSE